MRALEMPCEITAIEAMLCDEKKKKKKKKKRIKGPCVQAFGSDTEEEKEM
jgi:hypothetical protein